MKLYFTGDRPSGLQGTRGVVSLSQREIYTGDTSRWDVKVTGSESDTLSLEVNL